MYVFDIDGTIADCTHRLHYILERSPKDWEGFNRPDLIALDKPIWPVINILNSLYDKKHHIVLLTGRRCSTRAPTELWLQGHYVQYHMMLMRPTGDHRKDFIVKMELLRDYLPTVPDEHRSIETMFEDRREACRHFRDQGFHVCHVAEGDFGCGSPQEGNGNSQ